MDSFYLIVLGVAAMFLIIMLIFMGWMISHKNDQVNIPSASGSGKANACPDYWIINNDGSCKFPKADASANAGKIYNAGTTLDTTFIADTNTGSTIYDSNAGSISTDDTVWSGYQNKGLGPTCAKKLWADKWGVYWDGITNANYC